MPKSPDAFRTISEVADWLDVQAHVLRFWESKFSQVKPIKRAGGRRYYRPADMKLLGGIKKLLHDDGLTIKGVQQTLREDGISAVAALSQPLDGEDMVETQAIRSDAPESPPAVEAAPTAPEDATVSQPLSVVSDDAPSLPEKQIEDAALLAEQDDEGAFEPPKEDLASQKPNILVEEPKPVSVPEPPADEEAGNTPNDAHLDADPQPAAQDDHPVVSQTTAPDVLAEPSDPADTAPQVEDIQPTETRTETEATPTDAPAEPVETAAPEPAPPASIPDQGATPDTEIPAKATPKAAMAAPEATPAPPVAPDAVDPPLPSDPVGASPTDSPAPDPAPAAEPEPRAEDAHLERFAPQSAPEPDDTSEPTASETTDDSPPQEPAAPTLKPRQIDMPPLLPEDAFTATPAALSAAARLRSLTPQQADSLRPLLHDLARLRDTMAGAHKAPPVPPHQD